MPKGANQGPRPQAKASSKTTDASATAAATIRRCAAATRSPRFHASSGPNGMAMRSGTMSGTKVRLKKGAPTEIFFPCDRFERERVERADEDGGASRREQEIVEHERAFAADRREQAALRQERRAPGE